MRPKVRSTLNPIHPLYTNRLRLETGNRISRTNNTAKIRSVGVVDVRNNSFIKTLTGNQNFMEGVPTMKIKMLQKSLYRS